MNYIDTFDERPQDRLETILRVEPGDLPDQSPYPALDVLYRQILSKCLHWKVHSILRFLLSPYPAHRGSWSVLMGPDSMAFTIRRLDALSTPAR